MPARNAGESGGPRPPPIIRRNHTGATGSARQPGLFAGWPRSTGILPVFPISQAGSLCQGLGRSSGSEKKGGPRGLRHGGPLRIGGRARACRQDPSRLISWIWNSGA